MAEVILRDGSPQVVMIGRGPGGPMGATGPGTDLSLHVDSNGAAGDGVTDDTAAIQGTVDTAALSVKRTRLNAKPYAGTTVVLGANAVLETAGLGSTLKQKGAASGAVLLRIGGSGVKVGSLSTSGEIAVNTGEQNAGVIAQANATYGNLSQIELGNISGTDHRGDVLYIGTTAGYTLAGLAAGDIRGTNTLRNVVSIVGGEAIFIRSIIGVGGNGFMVFDIEPNPGGGGVSGVVIHKAKGRYAGINSPTAADLITGVWLNVLDLNPSYGTDSTPSYTAGASLRTADDAFQFRNVRSAHIETLNINGYNGQAIQHLWNTGELDQNNLSIGYARLYGNCLTDTVYNAYVVGASGHFNLQVGVSETDATLATHNAYVTCDKLRIGLAMHTAVSGSKFAAASNDIFVQKLMQQGGIGLSNCTRGVVGGGVFNGERYFSNCTSCVGFACDVTASVGAIVAGSNNGFLFSKVAGVDYILYTANQTWTQAGALNVALSYSIAGLKLLGPRKTGWSLDTGTAERTAHATYTKGAALTVGATYSQAEVTAIKDRLALVEQALQDVTRAMKALKDDLHATAGHGLIGT